MTDSNYKSIFKIPKFKPHKNPVISTKTVITIRIENDVLETIDMTSGGLDMSRNEFIVQCIDFALENMEIESNEKEDS